MKRFSRVMALFSLLTVAAISVFAQGGEGGTIIESNIGDDPSTFNPIIGNDASSSDVYDWMYPDIIALDDELLLEAPGAPKGMAESWEYDETGTVVTIKLRQDMFWADGTPVTADDWIWAVDAVKSGTSSSPRTNALFALDDGTETGGSIFDVTKIDDYTVEVVLGSPERDEEGNWTGNVLPSCVALSDVNDIAVVPSHIFSEAFGDDYASMSNDPYFVPVSADGTIVTYGEFTDPFSEFGVQVSLLGSQDFLETELGYVSPGEWIYRQVEDTNVEYEKFLAGDFTFITVSPDKQNEFRSLNDARPDGEKFQIIEYPDNSYAYVVWNQADPDNPVNGRDATGNPIDQGLHPVFGDKLVRQAMAHAVNVDAIIGTRPDENGDGATGILEGNGTRVTTHNHPGLSWVDPQQEPYAYDPLMTLDLLEEAGWLDNDGDGLLECNDCLYAREVDAAYNGTPLRFELLTNSGNAVREGVGETIAAQLDELGITVDFQAIEFGTLVQVLLGQSYDAIIIGWNLGLPFDPDGRWALGSTSDLVGSGFNTSSYYSADLEAAWEAAVSVPGCDQDARADLYREAMNILYEDQPYLWLYAANEMVAAQPNIQNFDPLPYNANWNIDAWTTGN